MPRTIGARIDDMLEMVALIRDVVRPFPDGEVLSNDILASFEAPLSHLHVSANGMRVQCRLTFDKVTGGPRFKAADALVDEATLALTAAVSGRGHPETKRRLLDHLNGIEDALKALDPRR